MEPEAFSFAIDKNEINLFHDVIENYYKHFDDILGQYLTLIGKGTTVIIISDHGMHAQCELSRSKSGVELSGDHRDAPDGIIIISGNGIKRNYEIRKPGKLLSALYNFRVKCDVYDIAPTILYLMGMPVAEDMDGEVITEIFTREFLINNSIKYIHSYEEKHTSKKQKNKRPIQTPLDEELIERLKALGYIK